MAEQKFDVDIQMSDNEVLGVKNPTTEQSAINKRTMDITSQNSVNTYAVTDPSEINDYTASFNPPLTSYVEGQFLKIKFINGNTNSATLNIDGLGQAPLVKSGGADLSGGEITSNQIISVAYDGVNFQIFTGIQGLPGSGSNITIYEDGTPITGTPHTTINFTGRGVLATNSGGGIANVLVPGQDRQSVRNAITFTTTSDVYVDMPSMSLTTKTLDPSGTQQGDYIVYFNCQMSTSNNTSSGYYIINVDGVDIANTQIFTTPGNSGRHTTTLIALIQNVSPSAVIKIRTRIQPGGGGSPTLSVFDRSLTIDGVNKMIIAP